MCLSVQHKQGEIKHVFRGNVFLTVRDQVENGGIVVCKAKHVELAGGTSHAVSSLILLQNSCVDLCVFLFLRRPRLALGLCHRVHVFQALLLIVQVTHTVSLSFSLSLSLSHSLSLSLSHTHTLPCCSMYTIHVLTCRWCWWRWREREREGERQGREGFQSHREYCTYSNGAIQRICWNCQRRN